MSRRHDKIILALYLTNPGVLQVNKIRINLKPIYFDIRLYSKWVHSVTNYLQVFKLWRNFLSTRVYYAAFGEYGKKEAWDMRTKTSCL